MNVASVEVSLYGILLFPCRQRRNRLCRKVVTEILINSGLLVCITYGAMSPTC
jgi:hypothetical protein